ncbi:MAG: 4-(cytidine 5'-diphospho)-2-C-methyl-D-erythritol kinase, partial [Muribaculaceae bacterium]|nr:4-(cytidine 5'-diphospho)-2-C-methyl-D-erythritol kinase [Muribaculaceae bacterium]
ALATGIGTKITPIGIPAIEGNEILVVKPPVAVSTAQAYAGVDKYLDSNQLQPNIAEILHRPIAEWRDLLLNDFEKSVFAELPILADIKHTLYELGALYTSMSGSGSAIYGIFDPGTIPAKLPNQWDSYAQWIGRL